MGDARHSPPPAEPVVLLPDGEECVTAEECVNECISLECQEEANGGVCPGECAALPTVAFEPDQDVDDNSVARLPCNELGTSCDNGGDCCGRTQCQCATSTPCCACTLVRQHAMTAPGRSDARGLAAGWRRAATRTT